MTTTLPTTTLPTALRPLVADDCPSAWPWAEWADQLPGTLLWAITGVDADGLRHAALAAQTGGLRLLPVVISAGEVRVGPL